MTTGIHTLKAIKIQQRDGQRSGDRRHADRCRDHRQPVPAHRHRVAFQPQHQGARGNARAPGCSRPPCSTAAPTPSGYPCRNSEISPRAPADLHPVGAFPSSSNGPPGFLSPPRRAVGLCLARRFGPREEARRSTFCSICRLLWHVTATSRHMPDRGRDPASWVKRATRSQVDAPLAYRTRAGDAWHRGLIVNISRTGALFIADGSGVPELQAELVVYLTRPPLPCECPAAAVARGILTRGGDASKAADQRAVCDRGEVRRGLERRTTRRDDDAC